MSRNVRRCCIIIISIIIPPECTFDVRACVRVCVRIYLCYRGKKTAEESCKNINAFSLFRNIIYSASRLVYEISVVRVKYRV